VISGFSEQSVTALPWKYVYELARSLAKKGCSIQIVTDESFHGDEVEGITVSKVLRTRQLPTFSAAMDPRQIDGAIEAFQPQLACVFGDPLVGYFVRRLRIQTPLVVNISKGIYSLKQLYLSGYSSPYLYFSSSLAAKFIIRLLNQRKIKAITVPTSSIRRSLEKRGVESKKIMVLPFAFDKTLCKRHGANLDRDRIRQELGLGKSDFVVTYFGPPYARRGVSDLVQTTSVLKQELPVRLLLLLRQNPENSRTEISSLRSLASRLGVADRVTFVVSVLPKEKLTSYLEASDVVALPFWYVDEEPPLGVLEALAAGKPVITTDIDSLPEIVDKNRGMLVRPRNVNDLAKAIFYLFGHPEDACSMAAEGTKFVQTLENWNELADRFLHLAERLSSYS